MARASMSEPKPTLHSARWFDTANKDGFMYRSWMKNQDILDHEFDGRPIIDICNTRSGLTPCNTHSRKLAEHVKHGIYGAGDFPVEFPMFSNGESSLCLTVMLARNLATMDVEKTIRDNPIDAVVLPTSYDKATPALLMGVANYDVPVIVVTGVPILNGKLDSKNTGSGTMVWQLHESLKAGEIDLRHFLSTETGMSCSAGMCNTVGTAFTVTCMTEALGISLPHNTIIPAVDARRYVLAHISDVRIVEMALQGLALSKILTRAAFENTIRINAAIGGSTNAMIHLKAIAGRVDMLPELGDWSRIGQDTSTIADLVPSGRFLMEGFYYAGGLPTVLHRLGEAGLLPHPDTLTINGRTLWESVKGAPITDDEVIRPLGKPLIDDGGIYVLRGNLAPRGAVLKPSAASPELLRHHGRAVVFENPEHYREHIIDRTLDVDAGSVLVIKNCGSRGYPSMVEVGNVGLPPELLRQGVRDMVRISDTCMSGMAYGTVVLHVASEVTAGGPLATVQDGDWIELDYEADTLHLGIDDAELTCRMAAYQAPRSHSEGDGCQRLYTNHILQADKGCDLGFLVSCRGAVVPHHSH